MPRGRWGDAIAKPTIVRGSRASCFSKRAAWSTVTAHFGWIVFDAGRALFLLVSWVSIGVGRRARERRPAF